MHTCRDCNQSFQTTLALEIHRDSCEKGQLYCQVCGSRFREADATEDGWHYACPEADCDGEGLQKDLYEVRTNRRATH